MPSHNTQMKAHPHLQPENGQSFSAQYALLFQGLHFEICLHYGSQLSEWGICSLRFFFFLFFFGTPVSTWVNVLFCELGANIHAVHNIFSFQSCLWQSFSSKPSAKTIRKNLLCLMFSFQCVDIQIRTNQVGIKQKHPSRRKKYTM